VPVKEPVRCSWARSALDIPYHDAEWGTPLHDDRALFELLVLEGAQAGLSWQTILAKRARYRLAFANFDIERVAAFGPRDVERLLGDAGIVRNRAKIASAIDNARAVIAIIAEFGSFDAYLWRYVQGRPIVGAPHSMDDVPASTPLAAALSKDLKARGCRFVGPTIVYAFMQATGLVNDHLRTCFRYRELTKAGRVTSREASSPAPRKRRSPA
jgi:DNA-3-methyladenine glycosylase I